METESWRPSHARTEGFACKRRVETKDAGAARAFVAGQSGNFLGSISLFVDYLGSASITEQLCADFVSDLARLPQKHGKKRDRVGVRGAIEDADAEDLVAEPREPCPPDRRRT